MLIRRRSLRNRGPGPIRESFGDRVFEWVTLVVITLAGIACLYPYLNIVAKSFSDTVAVAKGQVMGVWPVGFNTNAYAVILKSSRYLNALRLTVTVTLLFTLMDLGMTIIVAYAVSRKDMPGHKLVMILYIITMLFTGGLIPTYLTVTRAGLRNSIYALIIPWLVTPFNVVLMSNYFASLPESVIESATMDGASQLRVLVQIVIPLSLPSIATIGLFTAVLSWNQYFNAMIYMDDFDKATLQIYLRELIQNARSAEKNGAIDDLLGATPPASVQGAAVFATTLPIICLYPFLQKYYVKGITLGAVKG